MSAFGGGKIINDSLAFMVDIYDRQCRISCSLYWNDRADLNDVTNIYGSHSQFDVDGYPTFDKTAPCTVIWKNSDMKLIDNDFTVQFWFRRDGTAGTGSLGGSNSYHTIVGGVGDGQVILRSAGDRVAWWGRVSGQSRYHFTDIDASSYPVGEYIFSTFVKTVSGSYWYFDDKLVSTAPDYTASLDTSAPGNFQIGRNDNYVPNGPIPVIMIYDRVLTESEVVSNYLSGKSRFK